MKKTCLSMACLAANIVFAGNVPTLPPDSEYVVVKDGHLSVNGVRRRFWAAIGKLYSDSGVTPADTPEERDAKVARAYKNTDLLLDHFQIVGFNAFRLWTAVPNTEDYVKGDGSPADSVDYFLSKCSERGIKVWVAGLNGGRAFPDDVGIINDPATGEEWKKAIAEMSEKASDGTSGGIHLRGAIARFWDPRLEQLAIRHMTRVALHTNKHTGLKWADDPVFGVWELSNEEWWMRKMVGGQWQKLPEFFRASLIAKWNEFLQTHRTASGLTGYASLRESAKVCHGSNTTRLKANLTSFMKRKSSSPPNTAQTSRCVLPHLRLSRTGTGSAGTTLAAVQKIT